MSVWNCVPSPGGRRRKSKLSIIFPHILQNTISGWVLDYTYEIRKLLVCFIWRKKFWKCYLDKWLSGLWRKDKWDSRLLRHSEAPLAIEFWVSNIIWKKSWHDFSGERPGSKALKSVSDLECLPNPSLPGWLSA
jgi:hypothetical protein